MKKVNRITGILAILLAILLFSGCLGIHHVDTNKTEKKAITDFVFAPDDFAVLSNVPTKLISYGLGDLEWFDENEIETRMFDYVNSGDLNIVSIKISFSNGKYSRGDYHRVDIVSSSNDEGIGNKLRVVAVVNDLSLKNMLGAIDTVYQDPNESINDLTISGEKVRVLASREINRPLEDYVYKIVFYIK